MMGQFWILFLSIIIYYVESKNENKAHFNIVANVKQIQWLGWIAFIAC